MSFGEKTALTRKKKGFSQDELAKKVGTIAVTIGRYERNEIKPSIDIATKISIKRLQRETLIFLSLANCSSKPIATILLYNRKNNAVDIAVTYIMIGISS